MNAYVFPYEKVDKNSKVVLYAAGNVGIQYYKQLKENNYCDIILWLDKKPDAASIKYLDDVNIRCPEAIIDLNSEEYDFVIIAMHNEYVAKEAKKMLIDFGVAENKIIHKNSFYDIYDKKYSLSLQDFLNKDLNVIENSLIKYFYESNGDANYFSYFIDEILEVLKLSDNEKVIKTKREIEAKALEIIYNSNLTVEVKVVFLNVLFNVKCVNKDIMRAYVNIIDKIKDNSSLKYWLINDLSGACVLYPDALYEEYFADLKKLRGNYARELDLRWNPPKFIKDANRNICVVASYSGTEPIPNCHLLHMSPILRAIGERGFKIHLIFLHPDSYDLGSGIINPLFSLSKVPVVSEEDLTTVFSKDTEIHFAFNAMMKDRQQDILDLICKINPLCIFDFSSERSSISYYYSKNYPVIYFPLKLQGIASSTFFHKYIIMQGEEYIDVKPPLLEDQVLRLPLFKDNPRPLREFHRDEYGLKEDDFVVITVGNRLYFDISNELAMEMCELMRSNKKIKWVIAGCSEFDYINYYYEDLISKNVIFILFENDLPGLYGICDVYLNPQRTGGGNTIAWAMQQGLAVVSPQNAAAAVSLMGNKNFLLSESELAPYIKRLSEDAQLLFEEQQKSREISKKWDINEFADGVINCMDQLTEDFNLNNSGGYQNGKRD